MAPESFISYWLERFVEEGLLNLNETIYLYTIEVEVTTKKLFIRHYKGSIVEWIPFYGMEKRDYPEPTFDSLSEVVSTKPVEVAEAVEIKVGKYLQSET